ncbi:MAG: hypothetical protein ABOK23_05125 [Candidatus Methanoperedens sp.]|nr:hypothetical protein [Candidatus Methanoperedens sp.]MCZ7395033.1 hypothetical protein [Candidatus Methanoperedens sp.]
MNRATTIVILLILGVAIAGCVGNGDLGTAIDKWNKIADKTQEIRLLEEQFVKTVKVDNVVIESELAKDTPNFGKILPILDKWQKTLDEERNLLEEESSLISDFAGTTVNLDGDAKRYGDSALTNVRDSNRYATSSLDNYNRGIESLRMNYKTLDEKYYRQYEQYSNAADSDTTKSGLYTDKANDDIKKLEALQ